MHPALSTHWPLFDLRITTPRIELRYVDDELAVELAELAAKGIHDSSVMPFSVPWTDVDPPQQQRNTLQWYWRSRAELTPSSWHLPFAVIHDSQVVGTTSVMARDYTILRAFETGSWLGLRFQGIGLGKEMRRAALHLGFAGLGAEFAHTGAFTDNAASLGVTRSLGYLPEGSRRTVRRGQAAEIAGFRMDRNTWQATLASADITLSGVAACLDLLGCN
jgi:RimJ/RimL family protein N-acetyltransferase